MPSKNRENSENFSAPDDRATTDLSNRLIQELTQQEIAQLIYALFEVIPSELQERAIAQLSPATQQTVKQILAPTATTEPIATAKTPDISLEKQAQILTPTATTEPIATAKTPDTSLEKQAKTWFKLWKNWDAIALEAAVEEGQYMAQEAEWEPPYFDGIAFIEELEEVAGKMLPLLQTAFEHDFTPDRNFIDELLETESEISASLADWMQPIDELSVSWQITQCALQWEWLTICEQEKDAFNFVQKIRYSEQEFQIIQFERDAVIDFLTQLSEPDRLNIFTGLISDRETDLWQQVLSDPYSYWHELYLELVQQYAPDRYVDSLRETIPQRWQNGLPVIESLLAQNNYSESLVAIEETFQALFAIVRQNAGWTPETSLLVANLSFYDRENKDVSKLLSYYQQIARGLERIELANALEIQLIASDRGLNWSAMFAAFTEIQVAGSTRQALFESWRNYIDRQSRRNQYQYLTANNSDTCWILWLIDSITESQKGVNSFGQQVTKWIDNLPGDRTQLGANLNRLQQLTQDLTEIQNEGKSNYPEFYRVVICPQKLLTENDRSRQEYLKQYAPADLLERVINYWQTNLHNFIPKPELAQKSNYDDCARWMAALKELSPHNYETLVAEWRAIHQRRSNLWKAMKAAGLS
jgi:hypothetical protein